MNFLNILRRFIFIFFLFQCFIFGAHNLSATHFQEFGHPYIQTCLPGTFPYVNHFNSIVQNEEGFIFIGARNGIFRFAGSEWNFIPVEGSIHLTNHRERIIAYSKKQLGYLTRTPERKYILANGLEDPGGGDPLHLKVPMKEPSVAWKGEIIQVLSMGDKIFMLTTEGLYLTLNNSFSRIHTDFIPTRIIPFSEGIILISEGNSIYSYSGDQLVELKIPGGTEEWSQVVSVDEQTIFMDGPTRDLFLSREADGAFEFRIAGITAEWNHISCAARLGTGHMAFGTAKNGILITDAYGKALTWITSSEGLYSNDIVRLMADAAGNLWALHEDAISRIEIPSAFSFFDTKNGLHGNVKDLLRHNGILYAASSLGLYKLQVQRDPAGPSSGNAAFTRIRGIEGDCRCLAATSDNLLVGSSEGLFEVTGESIRMILDVSVNAFHYEPGMNFLFACTERGLRILNMGNRSEIQNFSLPNISIDDIAHLSSGIIWLSSSSGALYRSTKPLSDAGITGYESYTAENLKSINGSYIDLIYLSGNLYFSGSKGLFSYDAASKTFLPDTVLDFPFQKGSYRFRQIIENEDKTLWISIDPPDKGTQKIWKARLSSGVSYQLQPLSYSRLNSRIINCLYADQENVLWIGTHEGLLRHDPSFARAEAPASLTHITAVCSGSDPGLEHRVDEGLKIPHPNNRIRIEYTSTDYNCESSQLFQYRLTGLGGQWSEWDDQAYAEFSGLGRGNYEFQVRSQDIYGSVSLPDSFHFKIKAPAYAAWYAFIFYSLLIMIILYLIQKWRHLQLMREQYHLEEVVQERTESLIKEKEKTEDLLANILPKTTSDELKAKGKVTSSKFKMVTVLFADIQGFTKIAEHMNPDKLIDQLDRFYFHFDSVVEKYNIEKIKTIGDAYMAAGGIPIKNRTNPVEVVLAALEMQQHMKELKKSNSDIWDLRIGLHTGSVIAGVVGQKKYSYDIWGDTVNTASRMESSGEPGRVNISATTYKLIKDFFQCEFRGKMPVKYKGDIAMFFVNGLNPTYSEADRITPNKRFWIQVQLLRLLDLEEFIVEKLEKELPETLFFHNVEHTHHVYSQVELLGRGEKVSEEDLLLLRTAALLHDMGYIDRTEGHEERSVEFAREILPIYRYNETQIDRICDLIMATSMPPEPGNLLEQIICDANLDHLGRVDFLIQSDKLFQEYRIRDKFKSKKEWNHFQISFLESHQFYTGIANRMREVPREQQIENIRQFS